MPIPLARFCCVERVARFWFCPAIPAVPELLLTWPLARVCAVPRLVVALPIPLARLAAGGVVVRARFWVFWLARLCVLPLARPCAVRLCVVLACDCARLCVVLLPTPC